MPRVSVIAAVAVVAVALASAGCGGKKNETTSTQDWANGVCTAFTTWKNSLTDLQKTVKTGGLTQDSLNSAVNDAQDATTTLAKDLKKLGKPDTQAGQQAKDDVQQLSDELSSGSKTISDAMSNAKGATGFLTAVSTITSTLASMVTEVQTTVTNVQKLDPKGELEQAFKSAPACKPYVGSK
ncbi:MAG TPA: hypothetical protein VMB53_01870 [Gaiellaceae bacterium]|nr:hypothetical protein [Gaiellaceae bacterium]